MKKRIAVVAVVLIALGVSFVAGQQAKKVSQEPYTPTKAQWLVMYLNAIDRRELADNFSCFFSYDDAADSVIINVMYFPQTNRALMNQIINDKQSFVKVAAKHHGWESWVKVKENLVLLKSE